MVEALLALVVETDVVGCPVAAELLASGRELADQVGELSVVRGAAGLQAKQRGALPGRALPVGIELRGTRVEEDEAREVDGTGGPVEEV